MPWEVGTTTVYDQWWETLDEDIQDAIIASVLTLKRDGPALGRPLVDRIKGSRHHNMKELRPPTGNIRILFAFDPARRAILLIGGDKTNRWQTWYREAIPMAERLLDEHLLRLHEGRA